MINEYILCAFFAIGYSFAEVGGPAHSHMIANPTVFTKLYIMLSGNENMISCNMQ